MKRRQNVLIILFVIAIMAVYTGYEANKPQPIDWSPNFSISKKSPYGTYIIKDALPYLFPEGEVSFARMSVREQLRVGRTPFLKTYFFVSPFFKIVPGDLEAVLEEVEGGGALFVSAEFIPDTLYSYVGVSGMKRIQNGKDYLRGFEDKGYPFRSTHRYFELKESFDGEVLGYVDTIKNPKLMYCRKTGKYVVWCHWEQGNYGASEAAVFYCDSVNGDYYQRALSFLPPDANVVWDEYLKSGAEGQQTLFRVIFRYPALKWAYILLILGAILYVLFRTKREQRPIPEIRPLENRTLEFVSVVSSLYYKQRDHVAIANKRINSFLEEVRYNYKLRTEELDSSFIDLLSERSGVARGSVEGLIFLIIRIRKTEHVDEDQLRELVRYIELFKTKS